MACWALWSDCLLSHSQGKSRSFIDISALSLHIYIVAIFDIGEYGKQWENHKDVSRYTSKDKAALHSASRFFGRPYSHRCKGRYCLTLLECRVRAFTDVMSCALLKVSEGDRIGREQDRTRRDSVAEDDARPSMSLSSSPSHKASDS